MSHTWYIDYIISGCRNRGVWGNMYVLLFFTIRISYSFDPFTIYY